ncbi:MAG: hypothetical protein JWO66_1178 [Candidatus Eremiobacteraeota bacterium]|nr:hypothetical protein [Candidatus Eremiobacteraeota bacterium]
MLILSIAFATIVIAGLAAIAWAEPRPSDFVVWNDETERRLLRERKIDAGWW